MRKFIISATVAIVAAVSFAAPSQAGGYGYGYGHNNYGYKSWSYGHKSYGHKQYRYKSHGYKPYRFVNKWKPYGGKVVIRKGYNYY